MHQKEVIMETPVTEQNTASGIKKPDEAVCKAIEKLLDIQLPELREALPPDGVFNGKLAFLAVAIVIVIGVIKRRQLVKEKRSPRDILG